MGSQGSVCVPETDIGHNFEWDYTIIRRGQIFRFSINTKLLTGFKDYFKNVKITMEANGSSIDDGNITYNIQDVSKSKWNLKNTSKVNNLFSYHLETPCDCEPGEYKVTIISSGKILGSEKFLMLLNPWNLEDEVYMPEEEDRKEYVLNTKTIVYQGFSHSMASIEWNLEQFSKPAIEILLHLLKRIHKPLRSSVPKLLRELTALVNSNDDNGLIQGNWMGDYSDGKPPFFWRGSNEIFLKYLKKMRPVKYGQCFTFAAVLCSILRLLGVGSRVVSCFQCLHDSDDTLNMELYYDKDYNVIRHLSRDSVWNFHCWVECYFKCEDFDKYNGWQVCDATPQEASKDGRFVCGPTPVAAIKAGDLKVGYDSRYVFSEVNGDIVYKRIVDGKTETFDIKISKIGLNISTKAVGSNGRHDITDHYKYMDGSLRDIMARKNADSLYKGNVHTEKVVKIQTVNKRDHILMGEDLDLNVNLLLVSDFEIEVIIKCFVIQHPNIRSEEVNYMRIVCEKDDSKVIPFKVASNNILKHVQSDLCGVLVEVFVVHQEKLFIKNFTLSIKTPHFTIDLKPEANVCETCVICVIMENPLSNLLTDVFVKLEIGFSNEKHKKHIKKLICGKPIKVKFKVTPNLRGFHPVRAVIYGPTIPTFREVSSINIV